MKQHFLMLLVFSCYFSNLLTAQTQDTLEPPIPDFPFREDPALLPKSFEQVQQYFFDHFGKSPTTQKHYDRWENFFYPRMFGYASYFAWQMPDATKTTWALIKNRNRMLRQQSATCPVGANWTELGLQKISATTATTTKKGYGRVNAIRFHPTADTMYVCSPDGGIWKRHLTNVTDQWRAINDYNLSYNYNNNDISNLGINDMLVKPDSIGVMYAATGDKYVGVDPEFTLNPLSIGILKSFDYGKSWQTCYMDTVAIGQDAKINIYKLAMQRHNSNRIVAISNSGFYVTNDGQNFDRLSAHNDMADLIYHPADTSIVYAASKSGVFYKSTNGGMSFPLGGAGSGSIATSATNNIKLAVIPNSTGAKSNVIYAVSSKYSGNCLEGVYLSKNAGASFTKIYGTVNSHINLLGRKVTLDTLRSNSTGQGQYDLALTVDADTATTVYIGGINTWKLRVDTSGNGQVIGNPVLISDATSITKSYVHADIHDLQFKNGKLFVSSDGGIYKDTTANLNQFAWKDLGSGLGIRQSFAVDALSSQLIDGAQDNAFSLLTNAANKEWKLVFSGDGCNVAWATNTTAYIAAQHNIVYRYNTSTSVIKPICYSKQKVDSLSMPGAFQVNQNVNFKAKTLAYQNDTLYIGYESVWKSTNLTSSPPTFVNIGPGQLGGIPLNVVKVAPSNSQRIYVARTSSIGYTLNGGTNWHTIFGVTMAPTEGTIDSLNSPVTLLPNSYITDIAIHPTNPNLIWVTYSSYVAGSKVYKYERQANGKWIITNLSKNLPNLPVNTIIRSAGSKNNLYVGTDLGVYYIHDCTGSTDTMKWVMFNDTINLLPNVAISDLTISNNQLVAATFGRGIWRTPLADTSNNCTCQAAYNHAPRLTAYNTSPKIFCANDIIANNYHFNIGSTGVMDDEGDFAVVGVSSTLPIYFPITFIEGNGTISLDLVFNGDNIYDYIGVYDVTVYLLNDFLEQVTSIAIPVVITCGTPNEFGLNCTPCPIPACFASYIGLAIQEGYVGCDNELRQQGGVALLFPSNNTCSASLELKLAPSSNPYYDVLSPPASFLPLDPGNYRINMYVNGMLYESEVPVTIPSDTILNHLWVNNVQIQGSPTGGTSGSVSFVSGGGSGQYYFLLQNSQGALVYNGESEEITGLAPGTYTFTMSDRIYRCIYTRTLIIPTITPVECACTGEIISVVPNPFNGNFSATARLNHTGNCSANITSPAKLTLHNSSGILISTLYDGQLNLDQNYTLNFSGNTLSAGTYYLRLKTCGKPAITIQLIKN